MLFYSGEWGFLCAAEQRVKVSSEQKLAHLLFALLFHPAICCLIWHPFLLISLLSYCFLCFSFTSTLHNNRCPSSHAFSFEGNTSLYCKNPKITFDARGVLCTLWHKSSYISAQVIAAQSNMQNYNSSRACWNSSLGAFFCAELVLSKWQTARSEIHRRYCWWWLSCEESYAQSTARVAQVALSARLNLYASHFISFYKHFEA